MPPDQRPTDAELDLLAALWQRRKATVRELYETVAPDEQVGYTTVLKTLQIMHEKGLVARDESNKTHVYRPARTARATRRHLVRDLAARAFAGSTRSLILEALAAKRPSPEELNELRAMLDALDAKAPSPSEHKSEPPAPPDASGEPT
ncbi:MAG: BlaI/MecI/CopY family transcriptional regulator [Planctomycetota bacterium]